MPHIHLVDDEPHIIRVTRLSLERAGYTVTSSNNGLQALEFLAQQQPDVLITDIDMPKMTGKELCETIEETMPDREFPILVLTARAEIEHRTWTSRMQNLHFLEKPMSMRSLLADLEGHFADTKTDNEYP